MFLDPKREIEKHGGKLPHWQQGEAMQFVTFRLADSMPRGKLMKWREERDLWLTRNPKPWDEKAKRAYHQRFTRQLENWLDEGLGSCLLRNAHLRVHLEEALMRFQGQAVDHEAWVIMPNHVHLLFTPKRPMEELIKSWKGVSARGIGQGSIWQKGYRDTIIRDSEHYANAVRYIRRNPVNLRAGDYSFWQAPRAQAVK